MSSQQPGPQVPKKQHVVSQVVLRQWTVGGQLRVLNLALPDKGWRWATPAGSGYVPWFVRADAATVEARWKQVEDRLPAALAEIRRGGPIVAGSATERTVIECLAMHWARSKAVRAAIDRIYQEQLQASKARLSGETAVLDRIHLQRTGLHAAGPEARSMVVESLHDGPPEVVSGEWFASRVVHFYEQALDWYGRMHVQVLDLPADAEDLLISDAPVVSPNRDNTGMNLRSCVALQDARAVAMPLGPRVAVSLNPIPERVTVTLAHAKELNEMQRRVAADFLYRRPIPGDGPRARHRPALRPETGSNEWPP